MKRDFSRLSVLIDICLSQVTGLATPNSVNPAFAFLITSGHSFMYLIFLSLSLSSAGSYSLKISICSWIALSRLIFSFVVGAIFLLIYLFYKLYLHKFFAEPLLLFFQPP